MIYVDDIDALRYWRSYEAEKLAAGGECAPFTEDACTAASAAAIDSAIRLYAIEDDVVHLAVPHARYRSVRPQTKYRVYSRPLPQDSFIYLDKNHAIASPELCYLEMARRLNDRYALAILAYELCGRYTFRPSPSGDNFSTRPCPLTSVDKIRAYLDRFHKVNGLGLARDALAFAADESWSPMESLYGIRLAAPTKSGGYNLPLHEANGAIKLDPVSADIMGVSELHGDMVWRGKKQVVIEYNGASGHTGHDNVVRDVRRTGALRRSGAIVFEVVKEQYNSIKEFSVIANSIRSELGLPIGHVSQRVTAKREHFAEQLWVAERRVDALDKAAAKDEEPANDDEIVRVSSASTTGDDPDSVYSTHVYGARR